MCHDGVKNKVGSSRWPLNLTTFCVKILREAIHGPGIIMTVGRCSITRYKFYISNKSRMGQYCIRQRTKNHKNQNASGAVTNIKVPRIPTTVIWVLLKKPASANANLPMSASALWHLMRCFNAIQASGITHCCLNHESHHLDHVYHHHDHVVHTIPHAHQPSWMHRI